ncbi:hypothetical protein J6590_099873 [Homalodisca vitripennis]|nr:hypothetical protein J6590_099873 [Homalodisca vitripennis]
MGICWHFELLLQTAPNEGCFENPPPIKRAKTCSGEYFIGWYVEIERACFNLETMSETVMSRTIDAVSLLLLMFKLQLAAKVNFSEPIAELVMRGSPCRDGRGFSGPGPGFLSTGDSVLPGNLGLKDQLAALQWVQYNIGHFGGDKNSVTIFGESAGGASVHFHMISPRSKGLFHAAISQSGSALCPWAFSNPARHKQLAGKLAQLVGCPLQPSHDFRQCLMDLPAEKIVGVQKDFIIWDIDPVVLFSPAEEPEEVKDAFLTKNPWTLSTRSDIPWMVGFNSEDGAIKVASLTRGDVEGKFKQLNDDFYSILPMSLLYQHTAQNPDKVTDAIKMFYFDGADIITPGMVNELTKLYTDGLLTQGISDSVRRQSGPVFQYHFAYNRSFSLCSVYYDNPWHPGVCHFDELMYLFPVENHAPKLVPDDPDYIMSLKLIELWTNYAKNK